MGVCQPGWRALASTHVSGSRVRPSVILVRLATVGKSWYLMTFRTVADVLEMTEGLTLRFSLPHPTSPAQHTMHHSLDDHSAPPHPEVTPLSRFPPRSVKPLPPFAASPAPRSPVVRSRCNFDRCPRLNRHLLPTVCCKAQKHAKQSRDTHRVPPQRSACSQKTSRIVKDHVVRFSLAAGLSFPVSPFALPKPRFIGLPCGFGPHPQLHLLGAPALRAFRSSIAMQSRPAYEPSHADSQSRNLSTARFARWQRL